MRSGSARRPRLHGARVLTGAGRRGLHRWLRYAFLAWALLSTAWLLASYRTRGVAAALLASDARVAVQRTAEGLSFRPIGTARSTGLVFIATPAMVEAHRHRLPTHTRWVEIAGGNHAQFAHYGPQLFDGRPTISREAQRAQAREALLQALTP